MSGRSLAHPSDAHSPRAPRSFSRCYYLPGTYPVEYPPGSTLNVEVNSLVSSDTEMPFDYYSMPFCVPADGVHKSSGTINPGTIMLGIRIENSPYELKMMREEYAKSACQGKDYESGAYAALTKAEAKELKEKIKDEYRVRMILDNLPITTYDLEKQPDSVRPGFEVGTYDKKADKYYVNNHLMFKVLVHESNGQYARLRQREFGEFVDLEGARRLLLAGDEEKKKKETAKETAAKTAKTTTTTTTTKTTTTKTTTTDEKSYMVVGFEVVACSIRRDPAKKYENVACGDEGVQRQEVKEGAEIAYTYDVYWETSDISWASRWDAYLKMPGGRVHWFSIMNSLMVVVVMSCIVAMIMMRTIRRDLQKYEQLLVDGNPQSDLADESGWKMVSGDVFRAPANALSLAMHVGSGVQILASGTVTLVFATFGFLSPASRGSLLTAALILYLLMSIAAGYAAVWIWGAMNRSHDGWQKVCWRTACFFPGVTVTAMSLMNVLLHATGSSGAIPLGFFFSVLFLWLLISIPLAFVGGTVAARREVRPFPTRTNQIPRHIPTPHWASHPVVLLLAAGSLPFGTIFVELYFAMTSIWQGYFYYIFGFLFLVSFLTIVITIEVSIVCTYVQLCAEDYLWWWRSFQRGGAISVYVFLYSLGFLFNTLHHLSGALPVVIYLGYTSLMVWCLSLGMGAVGFLASYIFTVKIFESVKAD